MEICIVTGTDHVGEYYEVNHGEVWERCTKCGNLFFVRYHDTGSGG